jgi:hypothetical protein
MTSMLQDSSIDLNGLTLKALLTTRHDRLRASCCLNRRARTMKGAMGTAGKPCQSIYAVPGISKLTSARRLASRT